MGARELFREVGEGYFLYKDQGSSAIYDQFGRVVDLSVTAGPSWKLNLSAPTRISHNDVADLKFNQNDYVIYCGDFCHHFGHFLLDTLPNLWVVKEFMDKVNSDAIFLFTVSHSISSEDLLSLDYIKTCLNALGISAKQIELPRSSQAYRKLYCAEPSIRPFGSFGDAKITNYQCASVFKEIHQKFSDQTIEKEKIYFSRRKFRNFNSARKVANEEAVESLFESRGYKIVWPEQLSFTEQLKLVANASVLAGMEGSAMHLSAFLPKGSKTLVFSKRAEIHNQNVFCEISGSDLTHISFDKENLVQGKGKRKLVFDWKKMSVRKAKRGRILNLKKMAILLDQFEAE